MKVSSFAAWRLGATHFFNTFLEYRLDALPEWVLYAAHGVGIDELDKCRDAGETGGGKDKVIRGSERGEA